MDNADSIEGGGRLFSISPSKRHITKYSGSVCNGGKVIGIKKSKEKKQLKKLVKENLRSCRERWLDGEDALQLGNGSCKRFRTPKMFFYDCNTDYQASVPRKLRSAIRKRSNESISPPLLIAKKKKIKHVASGVELVRKDGLEKSNQNKPRTEVCVKDGTLEQITKDEVEVAEALFALAAVFPDATKTDKKKIVYKQSGASPSALPKTEESINRFKEAEIRKTEEEPKTTCHKDDKSICTNVLDCTTDGSKQPDTSVSKQLTMESGCHIPKVNLPLTAFSSENECTIQRPNEFAVSGACTRLSIKHGSKFSKPDKHVPSSRNHPQIAFELNDASSGQPEVKRPTKENGDTGSSLHQGLSSRMSSDHEGAKKHPAWFRSSCSISQSPISDSIIEKKDAQVVTASEKSWRRCSTHVYISRFIKASKMTDQRDRSLVKYSQITTNTGSKQGPHASSNDPSQVGNNLSGCSIPEKDATEVRNAILLHKRLVQDQQQGSKSGIHDLQKQSFEFLSLPTGSRVEMINSSNKPGQAPEGLSPLPFPYLQSQYQSAVPFPTSQNYYSSTSFPGYPSAAVVQKIHLPSFLGMPPTVGASASTSSQPEPRQQQKRASLPMMAHYKSGIASPSIQNWQSGLSELSPMIHHAQILFSPSHSPEEAIGSNYAPIIQQQQQKPSVSATALLPPAVKGQYHIVGGTHPAYADNLQSAYLKC